MDGFNVFVVLLAIVFALLQIILFFKIWGMTNDIREIKNKYLFQDNKVDKPIELDQNGIGEGVLVVRLVDGKQMRVTGVTSDGRYECSLDGMGRSMYEPDAIMEFERWVKEKHGK